MNNDTVWQILWHPWHVLEAHTLGTFNVVVQSYSALIMGWDTHKNTAFSKEIQCRGSSSTAITTGYQDVGVRLIQINSSVGVKNPNLYHTFLFTSVALYASQAQNQGTKR